MTAPPEVRQCQDTNEEMFGAVAVAGAGRSEGVWGVMHPSRGGHWAEDAEVENWAILQHPPPPEPPAKAVSNGKARKKAT